MYYKTFSEKEEIYAKYFDRATAPIAPAQLFFALLGVKVGNSGALTLSLSLTYIQFSNIINILLMIKQKLNFDDVSKIPEKELRNNAEIIMGQLAMDSEGLLDILIAANWLDVNAILTAGAKLWAKQYSHVENSLNGKFKYLDNDIKALIIGELTPREFLAVMHANENPQLSKEQEIARENLYKLALGVRYREKELPRGLTAKERYEVLHSPLGRFVTIPGGTYEIGSPPTEVDRWPNEKLHSVKLSPFSIMDAAVTQEAYAKVMGVNPSTYKIAEYCRDSFKRIEVNGLKIGVCADHPVESVSYFNAVEFAERMGELDPEHQYGLPTEAQLEVAFRGGTKTAYISGRDDDIDLGDYVWYRANSGRQSHPVKSKLANVSGVYRSSVGEWGQDWYDRDYEGSAGLDPIGPAWWGGLVLTASSADAVGTTAPGTAVLLLATARRHGASAAISVSAW